MWRREEKLLYIEEIAWAKKQCFNWVKLMRGIFKRLSLLDQSSFWKRVESNGFVGCGSILESLETREFELEQLTACIWAGEWLIS